MRLSRFLLLSIFATCSAHAQTVIINRPPVGSVPAQHQRVTVNVTLATPAGEGATTGDVTGGLSAANTSLYGIINRQCDVLGPQLKGDCRLVGITTNGTIGDRPGFGAARSDVPTISVTANATFEIDPKPAAASPH